MRHVLAIDQGTTNTKAFLFDEFKYLLAIVRFDLFITAFLFWRHHTVLNVLDFLWKFSRHLRFVPAEDERLYYRVKLSRTRFIILLFNRILELVPEIRLRTKKTWINKRHLRPQIHGRVFDRRTGQHKFVS